MHPLNAAKEDFNYFMHYGAGLKKRVLVVGCY